MTVRRYQEFHGRNPRSFSRRRFHVPQHLIKLGTAYAIEYVSDKWNGGGDGKRAIYRHRFESPATLYMDETGHRQLYLMGSRLEVTEAGIEN